MVWHLPLLLRYSYNTTRVLNWTLVLPSDALSEKKRKVNKKRQNFGKWDLELNLAMPCSCCHKHDSLKFDKEIFRNRKIIANVKFCDGRTDTPKDRQSDPTHSTKGPHKNFNNAYIFPSKICFPKTFFSELSKISWKPVCE